MFELHELSPVKEGLADQVGNHEENLISDDDVTIVLSQTDDEKSISEGDLSKKKRSISVTSDRSHRASHRASHTSPTNNKSKSKSKRGFNLKKKLSEESENVLQVKSVVNENQNGSPGKAKTPLEKKVEQVKLPNNSEVSVVRQGRKVIAPNINSITTRSPRKRPQSESLSLPDVYKTVASSFSSSAVEKPDEESTVKTRGRRAAATPHSTPKNNENQSESDGEKEELKGPAKFKKFKNMTDRMGSAVVLLQRLSPLIIFQKRVANQKSSSEEKVSSEKSAVPDETVTPKLVEENIPGAELILSLDELDDSNSKALSPRKREMESVSEGSEEKRPRVEEDSTLIVIATPDTSVTVLIEENTPTDVVDLQITEEKLVTTPRRRRGRPRKSITPVPTNQIALKEDDVTVVVDPESKKTLPAQSKPKLHSESSDELAEDFVEDAARVSERQPSAKESEASNQDTQSIDQKASPIENTPSKLTLKRGRGRPPKAASRSVLANILTRRNSNTSDVTPPKKNRLSDEISIISVVESRGDVVNSEKGNVTNDIQEKGVKSGARRGRGRPAKASISPKSTIEKSPVASRSTMKTTPLTPLERRMKCCKVLLERDPEVEALLIAMIRKRKKVAAATSQAEIPVATRVTRGMQKFASKVEAD